MTQRDTKLRRVQSSHESQINEKYATEAPNSGFDKGETLLNIY